MKILDRINIVEAMKHRMIEEFHRCEFPYIKRRYMEDIVYANKSIEILFLLFDQWIEAGY